METVVLSLGGSLVAPNGVDVSFVKRFCAFLKKQTGYRFVIVIGGGKPARVYQDAARALGVKSNSDLDWVGIRATYLNAELVRSHLGKLAHNAVVTDPTKSLSTKKQFVIACGWKPGRSTDYVAVELAKTLGATRVINLSNVACVCDKDPKQHDGAKCLSHLTWREYLNLVGRKWTPGMNSPFDPVAAKAAQTGKLAVFIADGSNLANLKKILNGKPFAGTLIA